MKKLANILRLFWGCIFLAGVIINLVVAIIDKTLYNNGGTYAWPDFLQNFWANTVIPNMLLFIILLAVIELILGLVILNRGKWSKLGLVGAVIFGAGLLMIGLGAKRGDWLARIPNLACLFFDYDKTFWRTLRPNKELTHTAVIGS